MNQHNISSRHFIDANQKLDERDYWLKKLAGEPVKASFPTDFDTINENRRIPAVAEFQLDGQLFSRLLAISNNSHLRLSIILVTGVIALLGKYTGSDDILVGVPIHRQEEQKNFINTVLVLRNQLETDPGFKDLLIQVSQTTAEAHENANYPMDTLLYNLGFNYIPDEDFPLFDVAVLLENIHEKEYLSGIHVNMVFSFLKSENNIQGTVEYNGAFYNRDTVGTIIGHLIILLTQGLETLTEPLSHIDILTQSEKKQLLKDFNDTAVGYPSGHSLPVLFEQQVARSALTPALVYDDRESGLKQEFTYEQLNRSANTVATRLREFGVGHGDIVALILDRSVEMMTGILGILKAGAAYVPVNPEYPTKRIRLILSDCNAAMVLTHSACRPQCEALIVNTRFLYLDDPSTEPGDGTAPDVSVSPGDLAYILYTSGSSGTPKGVLIEQGHVVNLVYGLKEIVYDCCNDRLNVALVAPFVFDASVQQIFAAFLLGHCLYIVPENTRVDGERLIAFFKDFSIDVTDGTPTHLQLMLNSISGKTRFNSLKHMIIGGEALPVSLVRDFSAALESPPKIINIYGPTECCVDCTSFEIDPNKIDQLDKIPIGKPMANRNIYILDRHMQLIPIGVPGQLCISGRSVGKGYLNRNALTAEKFRDNPFKPGTPMYLTGDLARWLKDGNIEFLGRIDQQVKIRGLRIELGEIENQLHNHQNIKEVMVDTVVAGDNDTFLCAYYVPDQPVVTSVLKEYLAQVLPEYMIPTFFVPMDSFPLTPNGKIARNELPRPQLEQSGQLTAPRNEVEKKMVDIWAEVLRLNPSCIGIDSQFFELGGHSLKATLLIARIHGTFNVKIPMAEIFAQSSIRKLAGYIEHLSSGRYTALEPLSRKSHYTLSSVQRRLFFLHQIEPDNIVHNVYDMFEFNTPPDHDFLETAFKKLIQRHESLRTSFTIVDVEPVQIIHDDVPFDIEVFEGAGQEEVHDIVKRFPRPFDLSRAPLMRVGVITTGETGYVLMVDMHHIIADGVSRSLLISDFTALAAGEELTLLTIQYKEFAHWQNQLLENPGSWMAQQETFWLNQFSDRIPTLNMPVDFARPETQQFSGGRVSSKLEKSIVDTVKIMALEQDVTMFMLLFALYNVLLSGVCGQDDIVVGTPVSGRSQPDFENIIGPFVNTIAIRSQVREDVSFTDFLEDIKNHTLNAFENQDYPFEYLVRQLITDRDAGRNRLFDVAFSFDSSDNTPGVQGVEKESQYLYHTPVAHFDLMLFAFVTDDYVQLDMEYATALYKQETVRYLLEQYREMMKQVLENKSIQLKDIQIVHDLQVGNRNLLKEDSGSFDF